MKIKSERIPIDESNITEEEKKWLYNEGSRVPSLDESKKTYEVIRVNDKEYNKEDSKETESFIGISANINDGKISDQILNNSPIKSNIDGNLSYTNIQDTNLSELSAKEAWGEIGKMSGNAATNALGLSNNQLNNIVGVFGAFGDEVLTSFDKNMVKLNELKKEKFKDLHPFDWKPGQTIPKDLMKSSLASISKDFVYASGDEKAKNIFKKVEDYVSPDPINYARESIKRTKGIYSTIDGDQSEISMMGNDYLNSYTMASGSESVSSVWKKDKKSFSPFNKSQDEIKFINALKNKNTFNKTLGYIYIRPNINYTNDRYSLLNEKSKDGTGTFQIPFEFNPEISEGDYQANYVSETLLNKIGQFQIYTGTNLSQLNISLKYMALTPDELDDELNNSMGKQFSTDGWQYYWTNNRIEAIEYKLRSLVFPDMVSRDYLVKPPLIEIHIGNESGAGAEDVGDLYKYPIGIDSSNSVSDEKYLSTTRSIQNNELNRYKKYIVTSVQIENLNEDSFTWPSLYGRVWSKGKSGSPINHLKTGKDLGSKEEGKYGYSGYSRRTGFKANLRCIEVTENFLDLVPDFKSYYDAWIYKESTSNKMNEYSQNILGSNSIDESADLISEAALTAINGKDILDKNLDNYFNKAYIKAKIYNNMESQNGKINNYNKAWKLESNADEEFYFINSIWNKTVKEIIEKNKANNNNKNEININGPVLFNVELDNCFESFLNKLSYDEINNIYDKGPNIADLEKGKPINSMFDVVGKKEFYGGEEDDILDIYNEENPLMKYLCNKSGSNTKFTDKECFFMLNRINELRTTLAIKINICEIDILSSEEIKGNIKSMFKDMISASRKGKIIIEGSITEEKLPDWKNNKCHEIITKENKKMKNYKYIFGGSDETTETYTNMYNINHLGFWDAKRMEDELNKCFKNNIPMDLLNIVNNNKLLSLLEKDLNIENNDNGKKFFKEDLKDCLEKNYAEKTLIDLLTKKLYNIYESCLNSLLESLEYSIKFVDASQSYDLSSIEAGKYLIESMGESGPLGSNIKELSKSKKKINCYMYDTYEQKLGKSNKLSEEVLVYDTQVKNKGIDILSMGYILEKMSKESDKALDDLNDLKKSIMKIDLGSESYFDNFKSIKFNIKKDENINDSFESFKNNQDSFIDNIKDLKKNLNEKNIQDDFDKIVGSYNDIKGLKPLDEECKNYSSNEKYIRKNIFKAWDESFGFDTATELVNEGVNFKEKFGTTNNGLIPNVYYKKYTNDNLLSTLQVASNNINNYGKLS